MQRRSSLAKQRSKLERAVQTAPGKLGPRPPACYAATRIGCTPIPARAAVYKQYVGAYAGRCRFRKVRARLMVRAFRSGGSFQGNTVISAFGASEAMSIDT